MRIPVGDAQKTIERGALIEPASVPGTYVTRDTAGGEIYFHPKEQRVTVPEQVQRPIDENYGTPLTVEMGRFDGHNKLVEVDLKTPSKEIADQAGKQFGVPVRYSQEKGYAFTLPAGQYRNPQQAETALLSIRPAIAGTVLSAMTGDRPTPTSARFVRQIQDSSDQDFVYRQADSQLQTKFAARLGELSQDPRKNAVAIEQVRQQIQILQNAELVVVDQDEIVGLENHALAASGNQTELQKVLDKHTLGALQTGSFAVAKAHNGKDVIFITRESAGARNVKLVVDLGRADLAKQALETPSVPSADLVMRSIGHELNALSGMSLQQAVAAQKDTEPVQVPSLTGQGETTFKEIPVVDVSMLRTLAQGEQFDILTADQFKAQTTINAWVNQPVSTPTIGTATSPAEVARATNTQTSSSPLTKIDLINMTEPFSALHKDKGFIQVKGYDPTTNMVKTARRGAEISMPFEEDTLFTKDDPQYKEVVAERYEEFKQEKEIGEILKIMYLRANHKEYLIRKMSLGFAIF